MAGTTTILLPAGRPTKGWLDGLRRLALSWPAPIPAPTIRRLNIAATLPPLDFHADAGAPEGALYVDGVLFGRSDAR